jgi:hypothetical protein
METPFLCKQLSRVRQIGSKVLKNTRESILPVGHRVQLKKSCSRVRYRVHITRYRVQSEWTSPVHSAHLTCVKDADAIWWWAWCRNRKCIKGPLQTFFYAFQKGRHIRQELCHWSHALQLELGDVKVVDPCNRGAYLHPLGDDHPNHCLEHLGQDCSRQDSVLPEFKSIYYTRYRTRYRYY